MGLPWPEGEWTIMQQALAVAIDAVEVEQLGLVEGLVALATVSAHRTHPRVAATTADRLVGLGIDVDLLDALVGVARAHPIHAARGGDDRHGRNRRDDLGRVSRTVPTGGTIPYGGTPLAMAESSSAPLNVR